MSWVQHITVASIVQKEDKFLFVEEYVKKKLVINQPAGHLEENESLQEACIRETLEETGYLVEALYLVGIYHEYSSANRDMWLRFCFACKVIKKVENYKIDDKISNVIWLTENEFNLKPDDTHRSNMVKKSFQDFILGKEYKTQLISYEKND
jgi:8-oxo-dGTP pyrophosphatase MutT (NUDIX family)